MDLDPIFQDQSHFPILSSILRGNSTSNPQIPTTMFPTSQGSIPNMSSSQPPIHPNTKPMLQISNHYDFAYTFDSAFAHNLMVTDRNQGKTFKGGWEAEGISLPPNIPIDANSAGIPFYNTSTPSLGQSSFIHQDDLQNLSLTRDSIDPTTATTVTTAPQSNAYSLHGLYNPSLPLPLPVPVPVPPPVLGDYDQIGGGDGVMRRQRKRVKEKNITYIKGQWSSEEDSIMMRLVTEDETKKWCEIAKHLKGRNAKQCRERWFNHLHPDIRKGPWSVEEDMMLMKAHQEVGNKWAEIARRIPGRPENTVKNHWNATKRRRNEKLPVYKAISPNISDGSMLQAYIKHVTPTTTPQEEEEEEAAPNNYNDLNNSDDIVDFPNYDFSSEDWVAELLCDGDGDGDGDAPVQVNGGNFDSKYIK